MMTDNEIINALECCKKDDCDNCLNTFGNCYANLAGYALDLINRQKAEIEALIAGQETLQKYIETAKVEAIKEFLERASGFVVVNVPLSMINLEYGRDVELYSDVIRVKDLVRIYKEMKGGNGDGKERPDAD